MFWPLFKYNWPDVCCCLSDSTKGGDRSFLLRYGLGKHKICITRDIRDIIDTTTSHGISSDSIIIAATDQLFALVASLLDAQTILTNLV